MNKTKTNPKETISFWVFGGDITFYKTPDGLIEDYKAVTKDLKESLNPDNDSIDFSIQTSNLFDPEITLPECAKVLNEEIEIMIQTIKTVLVVPDNILEEIKQTVTEYGEKYKNDAHLHPKGSQLVGIENQFAIAIEVQIQPVENDEKDIEIQVEIRAYKDCEDNDSDDSDNNLSEENVVEEKNLYFKFIGVK